MALQNIYLLQYNNYFNRIVKKEPTVTDYTSKAVYTLTRTSFNPNDGVNTSHVMNTEVVCDYAVVTDLTGTEIASRWFVVESKRERNGQVTLTLRRDLVVDYEDTVLYSESLIKRAILSSDDPLTFNKESVSLNQIKKGEFLLKDYTNVPWIVGYVDRKFSSGTGQDTHVKVVSDVVADYEYASWDNWTYKKYLNTYCMKDYSKAKVWFQFLQASGVGYLQKVTATMPRIGKNWSFETSQATKPYPDIASFHATSNPDEQFTKYLPANFNTDTFESSYKTYIRDLDNYNESDFNKLLEFDGQVFHITSENKYYRLVVNVKQVTVNYQMNANTSLLTELNRVVTSCPSYSTGTSTYRIYITTPQIVIDTIEVSNNEYTGDIQTDRLHLKDAPYDMFCIPYADVRVSGTVQGAGQSTNFIIDYTKELALTFAQGLALSIGASLYDLQIVPYCPLTGIKVEWYNNGLKENLNIGNVNPERVTLFKDKTNTYSGIILWAANSSGSFNISMPFASGTPKVTNQTDLWRLVSPNYAGEFEFNVARNKGLQYVVVDYTYRPAMPYIHVSPVFNEDGLYGQYWGDSRGLICGGDFSVAYLSNDWVTYQNNNKNYQTIFDREIQNMDVNREVQRTQEAWNIATGTLGGASTGAIAGGMVSASPLSAIAGGVLGAGASLAGGMLDKQFSEQLYQESKKFKQDTFALQLDNIKARPQSLAKTSGFTNNNKYFPFIEYYTCTDEEKMLFANYIRNYSMTVNKYDNIVNYINNTFGYVGIQDRGFIQAEIIKATNFNGESHELAELNRELNSGLYFKEA